MWVMPDLQFKNGKWSGGSGGNNPCAGVCVRLLRTTGLPRVKTQAFLVAWTSNTLCPCYT